MRVLFFGNNWVGWKVIETLRAQGDELVGLVLHPPAARTYGDEIVAASGLPERKIFDGARLGDPAVLEALRALRPELGLSAFFGYILKPAALALAPRGSINVHPALLPWNRGSYPNVWSIVDRTPAGATIHYMDPGVDTGDIIAQREVEARPSDTGERLYRRLERACVDLFAETWPLVREGRATRKPQPAGGTVHRKRDVESLDRIELDRPYTGRQLLDIVRARTFPPHRGAYFEEGGRRYHLRIEIEEEAEKES